MSALGRSTACYAAKEIDQPEDGNHQEQLPRHVPL
jgi:hypothetical protein